uniref:Uncharacterized protein n=1 Tax=Romanomermis culicivorax TaxID=13658 RepID=A0A915J7F6_ROMCU
MTVTAVAEDPQPRYDLPCTSHHEEDSRIKTIVNNMHPLAIDGATTNKRLLHFFIRLENEFSTLGRLTRHTPSDMIQYMTR